VRNETIAHQQNSERLLLRGILGESNFGLAQFFEIWIPHLWFNFSSAFSAVKEYG
jgi:hypothetical protein